MRRAHDLVPHLKRPVPGTLNHGYRGRDDFSAIVRIIDMAHKPNGLADRRMSLNLSFRFMLSGGEGGNRDRAEALPDGCARSRRGIGESPLSPQPRTIKSPILLQSSPVRKIAHSPPSHLGASPCAIASAVNCARFIAPVLAFKFREWKRTVTSVTSIALAMKTVERPSMRCRRHSRSRVESSGGGGGTLSRGCRPLSASAIEHYARESAQSKVFLGAARVLAAHKSDSPELIVRGALRNDVAPGNAEATGGVQHAERGMPLRQL
jgi:hypothetical protein